MTLNVIKLLAAAALAVVFVAAIIVDNDNGSWAVPLLGLLVGYVIGNAEVTNRDGRVTTPIVSTKDKTS